MARKLILLGKFSASIPTKKKFKFIPLLIKIAVPYNLYNLDEVREQDAAERGPVPHMLNDRGNWLT